jgi:hypothetical protein
MGSVCTGIKGDKRTALIGQRRITTFRCDVAEQRVDTIDMLPSLVILLKPMPNLTGHKMSSYQYLFVQLCTSDVVGILCIWPVMVKERRWRNWAVQRRSWLL